LLSQRTPLRGAGGYSAEALRIQGNARPFPQAERESDLFDDFFGYFERHDLREMLRGRRVLDFGSGYGGRTVDYRRKAGAEYVCGVEPFENMVESSRQYAAQLGEQQVEFLQCGDLTVPLPDASFDIVVSYDVLEHVKDPRASVAEIWRVLRPGGYAYVVFPVYFGAASHHLDYVVRFPALHLLFSPQTLVRAVNSVLAERPEFGTAQQPEPQASFDDRRFVLPTLNGLSGDHLPRLFQRFEVLDLTRHALLRRYPVVGWFSRAIVASPVPARLRDVFTVSVSCVLLRPNPNGSAPLRSENIAP
jgi:SAM-dependent methyltransferase